MGILTRRSTLTKLGFLPTLALSEALLGAPPAHAMQVNGNIGNWTISLTHADVQNISNATYVAAAGVPPPFDGYLAGAASYLEGIETVEPLDPIQDLTVVVSPFSNGTFQRFMYDTNPACGI